MRRPKRSIAGDASTKEVEQGKGQTHHLACSHADCLDREFAPAHVEKVLKTRTQKINNENIMKPLLPEVVYLGYPRCCQRTSARLEVNGSTSSTTNDIRPVYDMSDIRPVVAAPQLSLVPREIPSVSG